MKKLRVLFLYAGLRMHNHWQYGPYMAFALLSGYLKEKCSAQVDEIRVVDGSVAFHRVDELIAVLDDFRPHVVGLGGFSFNHKLLLSFAKTIKAHDPTTVVIIGGPHATLQYAHLVADVNVDVAVIGEGEETICELVSAIWSGSRGFRRIQGIAYEVEGRVVVTPRRRFAHNLTALHMHTDHDCILYTSYEGLLSDMLTTGAEGRIMTSRGCPYRCAYCHGLSGRTVRKRELSDVISEIDYLATHKNLRYFKIDDDVFNIDPPRAKKFARRLIDRKSDIRISFHNGLRADRMDEELVHLLREAGTYHFRFAVETASPRLQKLIRKDLDLERTEAIIRCARDTGAIVDAFFMLGFPGETKNELEQTLEFIEQTEIFHPAINFLQISPHTHMAEIYRTVTKKHPSRIITSETGGTYHRVTDNGFDYSTEYLRAKFLETTRKIFCDPSKVAEAYHTISQNLKPEDVRIYFGLRYGFPNVMGLTLEDLPDSSLGNELKTIASESRDLVMRALGYQPKRLRD